MTDPSGHVFLSYKHEQTDVANFLQSELERHGVPIWRDIFDLKPEPLRDEIIEQLENPKTASGIALVSKEVSESDIILNDELPGFKKRWETDDDFFVVIVPCPDISVGEAKSILNEAPILHDFSAWKMVPLEATTSDEAADVVDSVLSERIERIDRYLPDGEPIDCSLDTYESPAHDIDPAIAIDWSSSFEQGLPSEEEWNQRLIPALSTVTDCLSQKASGRPLRFRGRTHLPAAFAAGYCLPTTRRIPASWVQPRGTYGGTEWTLAIDEEDSGVEGALQRRPNHGSELAVLVNVAADVQPEIDQMHDQLPDFNGVLKLTPEDGPGVELTPAEAVHAADVFRTEVRNAIKQLPKTSTIHLFMASPMGLAFLFGQQSNTLRPIQTYLFNKDDGRYYPAGRLQTQPLSNDSDTPSEEQ
ncbi:SAVED domain-containing protein [Haladaptatus sp. NG-SE-30]